VDSSVCGGKDVCGGKNGGGGCGCVEGTLRHFFMMMMMMTMINKTTTRITPEMERTTITSVDILPFPWSGGGEAETGAGYSGCPGMESLDYITLSTQKHRKHQNHSIFDVVLIDETTSKQVCNHVTRTHNQIS
jgi:hypothetical protein